MKILVIANFPSTLDGMLNGRFTYLSNLLSLRNHEVEMIVSDFKHATKMHRTEAEMQKQPYPFKITYLHESGYRSNISPQRLISHYVWGKNVKKYLEKLAYKPDVVYVAIPSLTVARAASAYCKKYHIPFIIDVQDLWPEAMAVLFHNTVLRACFKPMEWYINAAYSCADLVVGVSDTYRDRALQVNRKSKKGLTVYLGNDAERFDKAKETFKVDKPSHEFWLTYIGTMGYSYDLECAIDAIRLVKQSGILDKKVKLLAMGAGPLLESFQEYAKESGIDYEFTGALPYEKMVGMLCSSDAVINCLRAGAAQSITNKVGDYALCGLPVINTQENIEYRQLVDLFSCGINCECGNAQQVADAILRLAKDDSLCHEMGQNSRRLGEERFDRRFSYRSLVSAIENCKVQ